MPGIESHGGPETEGHQKFSHLRLVSHDEPAPHPDEEPRAEVVDLTEARRRKDEARELIGQLAEPSHKKAPEHGTVAPLGHEVPVAPIEPPVHDEKIAPVVMTNGSSFRQLISDKVAGRKERGYKDTAEYRPEANRVADLMLTDRRFAKEFMSNKKLGSDYSDQGIAHAMAAASMPYLKRAMRAAGRGRYERMDIYVQAASDEANAIGVAMHNERGMKAAHEAGVKIALSTTSGSMVDYKPSRRPPNFLKRRTIRERLGIDLGAFITFK